jgi:hypothetical protein
MTLKQYRELLARGNKNARKVQRLFDDATKEIERIIRGGSGGTISMRRHIDEVVKRLNSNVYKVIQQGLDVEIQSADLHTDELTRKILASLSAPKVVYNYSNEVQNARNSGWQAFRQEHTRSLSERVWNITDQFHRQVDDILNLSFSQGESANKTAQSLKPFLKEPDKLFRRVRNAEGDLVLSKAAKAFHPGRGVYRSSVQNARRLARNETNDMYRSREHDRQEPLPWVVGFTINLSNNHTSRGPNGKLIPGWRDMCDDLIGDYPKWFKWRGWHVNCRCFKTPILCPIEEMQAIMRQISQGEQPSPSKSNIEALPPQFVSWIQGNIGRLQSYRSTPYFLQDNHEEIMRAIN